MPATSKPVTITLSVNASALLAITAPTQAQTDSFCTFSDDSGDNPKSGSGIEDFSARVYVNQNVTWRGDAARNPGYSVSIDEIDYTGDINFFSSTVIRGGGGRSGQVVATVNNDPSLIGKNDTYRIRFTVYAPNNSVGIPFSIDPKLQGNG